MAIKKTKTLSERKRYKEDRAIGMDEAIGVARLDHKTIENGPKLKVMSS